MQALALTLSYIGAPNQTYYNYFEVSEDLHDLVTDIELDLRKSGQLTDCHVLFHKIKEFDNDLLDDHILFNELGNSIITSFFNRYLYTDILLYSSGVPVMHVAPHEFPKVLYTAADNQENLHYPTIRNMIKIMRIFVYDFLEHWDSYISANNNFAPYSDSDDN